MTDYKKLVEALRYCGNFTEREGCAESCEYFNDMDCPKRIMTDAAAAIEALQSELKKTVTQIFGEEQQEWEEYCTGLMRRIRELKAQLPKRGKWITIRLNNGGSYTGCSCCEAPIPTDTMLDYIPESESKYCYSCGAKMTEVQDG